MSFTVCEKSDYFSLTWTREKKLALIAPRFAITFDCLESGVRKIESLTPHHWQSYESVN